MGALKVTFKLTKKSPTRGASAAAASASASASAASGKASSPSKDGSYPAQPGVVPKRKRSNLASPQQASAGAARATQEYAKVAAGNTDNNLAQNKRQKTIHAKAETNVASFKAEEANNAPTKRSRAANAASALASPASAQNLSVSIKKQVDKTNADDDDYPEENASPETAKNNNNQDSDRAQTSGRGGATLLKAKNVDRFLDKLRRIDSQYQMFYLPVTDDIAPGYSETIETPMDYTTISEKAHTGKYRDWNDVWNDVTIMFRNCCTYNPPDSIFYTEAVRQWEPSRRAFGTITGRGAPMQALGIFEDTAGHGAVAAAHGDATGAGEALAGKVPTTSAAAARAAHKRRTFPKEPYENVPLPPSLRDAPPPPPGAHGECQHPFAEFGHMAYLCDAQNKRLTSVRGAFAENSPMAMAVSDSPNLANIYVKSLVRFAQSLPTKIKNSAIARAKILKPSIMEANERRKEAKEAAAAAAAASTANS
ncbi:hypothetical protein PPROV_000982100 [Pycnococcus provasolii]|uniref:Bromo domain-containing protein n=1 Tax=Pycnococcus provasolii TaxID=41880 RepID=A0A830I069_9CHLO|nr:hypothetical protein PPROV_000982100 [Pycnococcus provasolii]|mmetsp:Transcript_7599/g.19651  ORF Transcript_7599/g.19651 Transcript_7599/m.19651 type:complete len:481 (+) Transcript_7599:81-1523(+)